MSQCQHCCYFVGNPDNVDVGDCHGNPPTVMLLPVAVPRAQQIASGGQAQGFALQTVRPTVKAVDRACKLLGEQTSI